MKNKNKDKEYFDDLKELYNENLDLIDEIKKLKNDLNIKYHEIHDLKHELSFKDSMCVDYEKEIVELKLKYVKNTKNERKYNINDELY
jgi:putative IMPACT (imprinted ancient) family translation regulator